MTVTDVLIGLSIVLNFVLGYFALRPAFASGDKSIVEATTMLLKPLQDRITTLERENAEERTCIKDLEAKLLIQAQRIERQQRTIDEQQARIDILVRQLRVLGLQPVDPDSSALSGELS